MSPLRIAVLGGAAVLALSAGAAFAAADSTADAPKAKTEKRVVIVQNENGHTTTYDSAVDHGPPPMIHGGDGQRMIMMHHGDGEHGNPEHAAKHLRDMLQLTPSQEPALQAFLGSMHPPHPMANEHEKRMRFEVARGPDGKIDLAKTREQAEHFRAEMEGHRAEMEKKRAEETALTTPQRLDRMVHEAAERSAKHQAQMQAHVDAVKRFYAALTPSQQKAFDAMHKGGMGGMMMHGPEHGGSGMQMHMMHMGDLGPMPPMPPLPPLPRLAMHAPPPMPPLPPLPPEPPAPPPPPGYR